jgi:hypothetical protein
VTDLTDKQGRTPEDFVRTFLVAYRDWELEATRADARAERVMRKEPEEAERVIDAALLAIRESYTALLDRFATPRVVGQAISPSWQTPPRADVTKTRFVSVERTRGGVAVRTLEAGHPALPWNECEYRLKLIDGAWRLDDRREQDGRGGWIRRVF